MDLPELTSIEIKASVGFITKYPPEFNFTFVSKISLSLFSIFSLKNRGILSLYFFIFLT